jgi:cysteine desulfurase
MGIPAELARSSLRITIGKDNTKADIDRLLEVLPRVVTKLRALAPAAGRVGT